MSKTQQSKIAEAEILAKRAEKLERLQNIKKSKNDIEIGKNKSLVDKIDTLRFLLSGSIIDSGNYSSDPILKPILEDKDQIELVRNKIIELVEKL